MLFLRPKGAPYIVASDFSLAGSPGFAPGISESAYHPRAAIGVQRLSVFRYTRPKKGAPYIATGQRRQRLLRDGQPELAGQLSVCSHENVDVDRAVGLR